MDTGDNMTTLQKRLLVVISILTAFMVFVASSLFMAFMINPDQLYVRYQSVEDTKISQDIGVVSMVYFTDVQYGKFQDDARMEKLIHTIQDLDPGIVIFGGDLYDDAYTPSEESNQKLIQYFNQIEAPLGKFCVLGEKDQNETKTQSVQSILNNSGFEILSNTSVRLLNCIRLTGLATTPDYSILSANAAQEYNIVVSHYPDVLLDQSLQSTAITLALAGHAHGTQLTYPWIGAYRSVEGATSLNRAQSVNLPFETILSAGVGCTKVDARLNADPEIHYFLFSHKN